MSPFSGRFRIGGGEDKTFSVFEAAPGIREHAKCAKTPRLNRFKINGATAYDDSDRVSDVLQPMTGSYAAFGKVRGRS